MSGRMGTWSDIHAVKSRIIILADPHTFIEESILTELLHYSLSFRTIYLGLIAALRAGCCLLYIVLLILIMKQFRQVNREMFTPNTKVPSQKAPGSSQKKLEPLSMETAGKEDTHLWREMLISYCCTRRTGYHCFYSQRYPANPKQPGLYPCLPDQLSHNTWAVCSGRERSWGNLTLLPSPGSQTDDWHSHSPINWKE